MNTKCGQSIPPLQYSTRQGGPLHEDCARILEARHSENLSRSWKVAISVTCENLNSLMALECSNLSRLRYGFRFLECKGGTYPHVVLDVCQPTFGSKFENFIFQAYTFFRPDIGYVQGMPITWSSYRHAALGMFHFFHRS